MPANDRLRLHQNQRLLPFGPEAAQCCPKQSISGGKARPRASLLQNGKLLPQGQVFQEQIATRTKGPDKQYEQKAQHGTSLTRKETRNWLHLYLTDCAVDHNSGEAQPYQWTPEVDLPRKTYFSRTVLSQMLKAHRLKAVGLDHD
jgi:hypothetical protein